jgi:glycosyltransferase involved in cell wall biosynthesis
MTSVEHVITGLDVGGAELMLQKLLRGSGGEFRHGVTSLSNMGAVGGRLRDLGVSVRAMHLKKDIRSAWGVLRLVRRWRTNPPDIVQTWLYHADLVGGLAAVASGLPVIWNIRQSNLDPGLNKPSTLRLVRLCARLSKRIPARIVCGSEAARVSHERFGFCASKLTVIPNGFDLDAFRPAPAARGGLRSELDLSADALLVGRVGRFDPQKDHRTFVEAAPRIAAVTGQVYFVMAGSGIDWHNTELVHWINDSGIRDRFKLLGNREDVPRLNAALDLAVSSSCGEGFPNVVGEAMACGVACVVTDVGDSSRIVGATGRVVPPADPRALADACVDLLAMPALARRELGLEARKRIEERYNLPRVARCYENLYSEVLLDVRNRRLH